jgi:hypothetical protein
MNEASTMTEACGIYELSEEQLDEVNGGGNRFTWSGAIKATAWAVYSPIVWMTAMGIYDGSHPD